MRRFSVSIEDRILRMATGDEPTDTSKGKATKDTSVAEATKAKSEAQAEGNKQKRDEIELNDQLYERLVNSIDKAKELYNIREAVLKVTGEEAEKLKEQLKLQDSYLNLIQLQSDEQAKLVKLLEIDNLSKEERKALEQNILDTQGAQRKTLKEIETLGKDYSLNLKTDSIEMTEALMVTYDRTATVKERLKALQKIKDLSEADKATTQKALQMQDKIDGVAGKIANHMGMSAKFSDTKLGNFTAMVAEAGKLGGGSGMGLVKTMMGKSLGQAMDLKNVFSKILEFSAKSALEISNLSRSIGAATGFGDKFNKQITSMGQSGNMAGIGFKESAAALTTLTGTLSSFNPEAVETNKHVGMTVARLSKLGVNAGESAAVIDVLQRSMGISAEAAADMTAEIALMGREVGITTSKMMKDFTAAQGRLAAFGRESTQIFKELAAQAKATGIAMSTLTSVAKTYDTFDAAADSIGKMNAVLGTQLSTLEMLEATDSERIMMIQQQVKMSVGNFDSLDRYTKMYIAQAMGVSDVAEAQRLLNMSTAEYQKTMNGQQKSADIQQELADATEELVPMMQQLKLVGIQIFMAFKPIITVFSGLIKVVSMILSPIGWIITALGELVGGPGEDGGLIEGMIGMLMLAGIAFKIFGASVMAALGPIGWFALALTTLFGVWHLKGSPELYAIAGESAKGYDNLASSMGAAVTAAEGTSAAMKGVHDSMHKAGGKSFNIEAMAKMDTGKIADGLTKVKSAMMELSTLKIDGFLAMSTDGAKSSIVMGSQGVIKSLSEGRLSIDVNMPEIALPPINVVVKVDDVELKKVLDARIEKRATGA